MTFLKFKLGCVHADDNGEEVEMFLVDDDMCWTFECPKCGRQINVTNWTTNEEETQVKCAQVDGDVKK